MIVRIFLNENYIKYKLFLFRVVVCNRFCYDLFSKGFCWIFNMLIIVFGIEDKM